MECLSAFTGIRTPREGTKLATVIALLAGANGATIEVFYADRALETFGRGGAAWFWWYRRRGFSPTGSSTGPFATSYAAYRDAVKDEI